MALTKLLSLSLLLLLFPLVCFAYPPGVEAYEYLDHHGRPTCVVPARGNASLDDAPAILRAFSECGQGGHIVFQNTTYNINTVMNTTGLTNCVIDIHGYLLWTKNIEHWLNTSIPIGYQNQSTVWSLGGDNIQVRGYGLGTLDGNGQAWYDVVKGVSNYPRRPMGLTIWHATNSVFEGLRFLQSQMWTMTIMYSQNVLMEDIYVNSTSMNGNPARNTDGADTLFSDNITMRRWEVDNGDDAIALKANSTNILIEDSIFRTGQGFAIGSIGQYKGVYETVQNVVVRNITCIKTKYAGYLKTWTGVMVNYPPNGGGGGIGLIRNITMTDFTMDGGRGYPFSISQCTSYSGATGSCDTSTFKISDVVLANITGTVASNVVGNMQCSSAAGGCDDVEITNIDLVDLNSSANSTSAPYRYLCNNVDAVGFACTGNVTSNSGGS